MEDEQAPATEDSKPPVGKPARNGKAKTEGKPALSETPGKKAENRPGGDGQT